MSERKHAEIIKEMNSGPIPEHRHGRVILRLYAYELDAAHKRECGDAAKLREALEELVANIEMRSSSFVLNVIVDTKTYLDAKTALATTSNQNTQED